MTRLIAVVTMVVLGLASAAAQDFRPGFILKSNGDSVAGFIDYRSDKMNSRACLFKPTRKSKKTRFLPAELKGYGFANDKHYQSRSIILPGRNKQDVFVQVLVRGTASLFKYKDFFLMEKDSLFLLPKVTVTDVEMPGPTPLDNSVRRYKKSDKKYIGILNYVMADCSLSADETKYYERSLVNLIQNYNRCKGNAGLTYKTQKPWTKLHLSIFTGIDQSSLVSKQTNFNFEKSISVPVGIGMDLSSPRVSDKSSFTMNVGYTEQLYQAYSETTGPNGKQRNDLVLNVATIKVPFGFRYNFAQENRTPYIKLGAIQSFLRQSSADFRSETESGGVVKTEHANAGLARKRQFGFWLGAGYCRRINQLFSGFVEVRYESNSGFAFPDFYINNSGVTMSLLVGIRF